MCFCGFNFPTEKLWYRSYMFFFFVIYHQTFPFMYRYICICVYEEQISVVDMFMCLREYKILVLKKGLTNLHIDEKEGCSFFLYFLLCECSRIKHFCNSSLKHLKLGSHFWFIILPYMRFKSFFLLILLKRCLENEH